MVLILVAFILFFKEKPEDIGLPAFKEADESLDIDGWDAAHKISILAFLAHGVWIKPANMLVKGIRGIRLEDMKYAKDTDSRIKLIASVRKNQKTGKLFASVAPK